MSSIVASYVKAHDHHTEARLAKLPSFDLLSTRGGDISELANS